MKRITTIAIAIALIIGSSAAFADDVYPALTPKNSTSMALGGSFTSIPTAEFSFFGNPAAFAAKKGSLTLLSVDTWAYVKPTSENLDVFGELLKEGSNMAALAGSLMPTNNGIGAGASLGIGYAGKGLGIGAFAITDNWADGDSLPGATLDTDTQVSAVVGLGFPIELGDSIRLSIGGDLRPFYRIRGSSSLADFIQAMEQGSDSIPINVNAGFGLAVDLGAHLELGSLGIGLAVRDIAPPFAVWSGTFDDLSTSLEAGELPKADGTKKAVFLPSITAGLSWKPKLLPGLIDPALYFELQDPVAVFRNADGIGTLLNLMHAGAEVKFLKMVSLRAGLNRGWLSAGVGLKLLFVDLNAAVFTEELGALPGDNPRSGFSLSTAIRF